VKCVIQVYETVQNIKIFGFVEHSMSFPLNRDLTSASREVFRKGREKSATDIAEQLHKSQILPYGSRSS
jgi:hypothetical protein